MITFVDLSQEQTLLAGTYEWRVWIDVDGNSGTGRSIGDAFDGSEVELLFSTVNDIWGEDYGQYQDPGTLADFVGLSHWDASLYTWVGATSTLEFYDPNVLVDGNTFVFGSFAHWEPYANLNSNFVVRIAVSTPSGSDQTDTPLTGNGSVTDAKGDAGSTFADIVSVKALFNVP